MSLLEAKSQVNQFLAFIYLADFAESMVAAPKSVVCIDLFASDLDFKTNRDLV